MADHLPAERIATFSDYLPRKVLIHPVGEGVLLKVPSHITDDGQVYVEVNVHLCVKDVANAREGREVDYYYMGAPYDGAVGKTDRWSAHLEKCEACRAAQKGQEHSELDWLKEVSG